MNLKYLLILALLVLILVEDVASKTKKKKKKKVKKVKVKKVKGKKNKGEYDYADALKKSIMFYEAQRSGELPKKNRIKWRGDSALLDGQDVGVDLTGGWNDAGDWVKFSLPLGWTTTVLSWGIIDYLQGYQNAKQTKYIYESIRWALDYILKTHPEPGRLYVQVGNASVEHKIWGRPEDMNQSSRVTYQIGTDCPGSDVAGSIAAALAAGSIVFKEKDPEYSDILLSNAIEVYELAHTFNGSYHDCLQRNKDSYVSKEYTDELIWGALWLYRATGDADYLQKALEIEHRVTWIPWTFDWSNCDVANEVLLYQLTEDADAADNVRAFLNSWIQPGNGTGAIKYTPKGLAFRIEWGSLRHAANVAFLAFRAADLGIMNRSAWDWAAGQIHYILGKDYSFVVGYGKNYPQYAHHRGASCPKSMLEKCDWNNFLSEDPNPNILVGAMVGGPTDEHDTYVDARNNYKGNEVSIDYNAGFQSALAALLA